MAPKKRATKKRAPGEEGVFPAVQPVEGEDEERDNVEQFPQQPETPAEGLDALYETKTHEFEELITHPETIDTSDLPEDVKVAANFASEVVKILEHVPVERRQLFLSQLAHRAEERGWRKTKRLQLERLQFLVEESRKISEELKAEDIQIPNGVSQVFGKKGLGEVVENAEYTTSTGLRMFTGALEFGVSATAFLTIMKAVGMEVSQGSPLHFVALGLAAAIVPLAEAAKGTAVARFVGRHPFSMGTIALASVGAALAVGNSATFLQAFGESDQSADTVGQMTRAIDSIRHELDRVRVSREDGVTSDLEGRVAAAQTFFERMIRGEATGQSEAGIGGSGRSGVGNNTAIKAGITGVVPGDITIPASVRERPEVQGRIRAARDRINARMRAIDPRYELHDGESIPQALDRYLQMFGTSSAQEFEALEGHRTATGGTDRGEYADLMDLAQRIERNAEPMQAKLNTATAQPTPGAPELNREKSEIRGVLNSLSSRVQDEVSIPIRTLFAAVSQEMNALGDPQQIELEVPEFNPNTSLLDQVQIPHAHGLNDPELYRSILIEKFGEKGIWVLLFTLFAFSGIGWTYAQAKRLDKKQAPIVADRIKQIVGNDEKAGIEMAYAEKTAERFTGQLNAVDGLLKNEGVKALLPFGGDLSWFQLSPLEVMVAWREGAAKADHNLNTHPSKGIVSKAAQVYIEGLKEMARLAPESAQVRALNTYLELLESDERRTLAVEEAALPGFTKLVGMSIELARLAHDTSPEKTSSATREKVRQYQASLLKMSFDHIAFRARIAQTTIGLLKTTYDQLREKGEFKDLDVVGLTELPRDVSFDLLSSEDLPEVLSSELLRGSALRSVTITALERRMRGEQQKLEQMSAHLQTLLDTIQSLAGKTGATDPSFIELAAKVRAEIEVAKTPFEKHKKELLDPLTSSGGIKNLLHKDVRATTRTLMREGDADAAGFDARDQLKAIRSGLKEFADSIAIPGYQSSVRLERKARDNDDDSVADYLAVVVQVRRSTGDSRGGAILSTMEFPLRNVLGKGTDPAAAAQTFENWRESTRSYFLLTQKYDEAKRNIENLISSADRSGDLAKDGSFPDVNLADGAAARRAELFYSSFLPARSKRLLYTEINRQLNTNLEEFQNKRSKRISEKEYNKQNTVLQTLVAEAQKVSGYTYNFASQQRKFQRMAELAQNVKGARITFKPYDPVQVGLDQVETFVVEDTRPTSFIRKAEEKRKTLSFEELERALERGATDYASLVKTT